MKYIDIGSKISNSKFSEQGAVELQHGLFPTLSLEETEAIQTLRHDDAADMDNIWDGSVFGLADMQLR